MEEKLLFINITIGIASLILVVLGFILSVYSRQMMQHVRKWFSAFFAMLILCMGANLADWMLYTMPKTYPAEPVVLFIYSLSSSILPVMLSFFMLSICGEDWRRSILIKITCILWLIYCFMLVTTWFEPWFYYYDSAGAYHRGILYPVFLAAPVLIMLANLVALFRRWKKFSRRYRNAFLVYLLLPVAAMVFQMFYYGVLLVVLAIAISSLVMFLLILYENVDIAIQNEKENAEKEIQIKVLQMRPHFIYNTLTSIYYLCPESPKAQEAILDFTTYLQKNFTAIAKPGMIPFEEELKHTKAYLSLEKIHYEDQLQVEYDIQQSFFRLPPLTLEPIVENAVKHGALTSPAYYDQNKGYRQRV